MQAALPAPPARDSPESRTLALRRSNSTGDLEVPNREPCPKCDFGQLHKAHTYKGTCKGLPASVYFGPKGSKRITDAPSPLPTETTRRVAGASEPSTPSFVTAEQNLEMLLERQRRAAAIHEMVSPRNDPQPLGPATPQPALAMPSSFGSANSQAELPFILQGLRFLVNLQHLSPEHPGSGTPSLLRLQASLTHF